MARKIYTALDLRGNSIGNLTLGNYDDELLVNPGAIRYNEDENRIEFCNNDSEWIPLSTIEKAVRDILLHRDDPDSSIVENGIAYLDGILDIYALKEGSFNNLFNARTFQVGGGTEQNIIQSYFQIIGETPYLVFQHLGTGYYVRIPFNRNISDLTNLGGQYVTLNSSQNVTSSKTWKGTQVFDNTIRVNNNNIDQTEYLNIVGERLGKIKFYGSIQNEIPTYNVYLDTSAPPSDKLKTRTIAFKEDPKYFITEIDYQGNVNPPFGYIYEPNKLRNWYRTLYNDLGNYDYSSELNFNNSKSLKLIFSTRDSQNSLTSGLIECNWINVTTELITIKFSNSIQFTNGGTNYIGMKHSNNNSTFDPNSMDWSNYEEWDLIKQE